MIRRTMIFTTLFLLLSWSSIAEGGGRFRCRGNCLRQSCCPVPCQPDDGIPRMAGPPVYTGMGTVEQLATSVVKAALTVNQQKNLDPKTKEALLTEFEFQIGPVARDAATLANLLADGIVDRNEIQTSIGGEIKGISNRLRQR